MALQDDAFAAAELGEHERPAAERPLAEAAFLE